MKEAEGWFSKYKEISLKQGRSGVSQNYYEKRLELDGKEQESAEIAEPRDGHSKMEWIAYGS